MIHNSVFCFLFSSSCQTTSKLWSYRDYNQVARKLPLWGFVKQSNKVLLTVEGREKRREKWKREKCQYFRAFGVYSVQNFLFRCNNHSSQRWKDLKLFFKTKSWHDSRCFPHLPARNQSFLQSKWFIALVLEADCKRKPSRVKNRKSYPQLIHKHRLPGKVRYLYFFT